MKSSLPKKILYRSFSQNPGELWEKLPKKIPLPLPEFIVLYNGTAPYDDEKILKLSDSFYDPRELGLGGKAALELEAKVYNINQGHNGPIIRRCKTLEGYSAFIAKVREYAGEGKDRDEAMGLAIKDCIEAGILREFLESHSKEVLNMLTTEWNWDDALAVTKEEGREEGREEGLEEAAKDLLAYGMPPEQICEALHIPPEQAARYLN